MSDTLEKLKSAVRMVQRKFAGQREQLDRSLRTATRETCHG